MMVKQTKNGSSVDIEQRVFSLQHIETGEFICLLQEGTDYLACFSDGDTALQFREELGLQEHVDLYTSALQECPFRHFWLDGKDLVIEA